MKSAVLCKSLIFNRSLAALAATFFLLILCACSPSQDEESSSIESLEVSKINLESGELVYAQQCSSCHGAKAEGNIALGSPSLAGQQSAYLLRQLQNFSSGQRGDDSADIYAQQMLAIMANQKNHIELESVSAYLQSLPITSHTDQPSDGNKSNGYNYYQGSCGSCHGANAEGNIVFNAPRLNNQSYSYLKRQYQNFLEGKRGKHKEDRYGRQMRMIAGTVQDEQTVIDILTFISSLENQK